MKSPRLERGQYHVGVVLLIMATNLAERKCCSATSTASPSESTVTRNGSTLASSDQGAWPLRTFDCSKISPSATLVHSTSTETRILNDKRKITRNINSKPNDCTYESNGSLCSRFVDKYSSFYLKTGGWLMLGIVLAGVAALVVTHILGMRSMRRPRRRQLSRILWVEALTKSKVARFV